VLTLLFQDTEEVKRTTNVMKEVRRAIRAFDPKRFPAGDVDLSVFDEIGGIEEYLAYRRDMDKHVYEKVVAVETLQNMRAAYVEEKLHEFDKAKTLAKEHDRWK